MSTFVFSEIEDSQFGTLFNQPSSVSPGQTTTFRFLQPAAPTIPGTYDIDVTYTGTDAAGNSAVVSGTYTIIVPEPSATLNPAVTDAVGFCTDPTQLTTCGINIPGSPNTVTVLPNEPLYLEFAITNTSLGTLVFSEIEDDQFGILRSGPSSISAGLTTTFRFLETAPSEPGIYDIGVTYRGQDQFGNQASATDTYTIIVEGPNATLEVAVGDGDDFCSDETNIATCASLPITATNTITLVPNETYLVEYEVENTGTTDLEAHIITDNAIGTAVNNSVLTLTPGQSATFRQLITAPITPGTYDIEVTYEGTDSNGETVALIDNYILEVLDFDVNFNVAVANANSLCTNPGDLSSCGFIFPATTNTASVPPGAPIYLEYQVTDAGDVPVVLHSVVDNTYGTVVLNDFTDISVFGEVIFRTLQNAPMVPGIYDYTASYTGEDDDGNQLMREATYTLIVGCPEECFIQGPSGTVCPGTYEFSADFDATICTDPMVDWVVTDAAGGTQSYTGNPVMIPLEGCAEDYTIESTVSCVGCTEPAVCTTTVTTEDTTPPDMQCTTVEVTFDACPDGFGPNFPNGQWLTVGSDGIINESFGGVFLFPIDLNACLSDNCTDLAELEYTLNDSYTESITPGCSITLISELQFRDKCGNVSPNLLILRGTIEESNPTPPTIACPADMTVTCLDSTDPSATGMATGSDDCDDEVDISFMNSSVAGCGNTEVITRTWTATNGCGLTATCEQIITVESVQPTISCPADITIDCGASSDPSNTGSATGTDPCGGTVDIISSDVFVAGCSAATGTITRTWTATNECGLSISCDQIITIVDNTAPEFDLSCQIDEIYTTENGAVCPADATISLSEGDDLTVDDGWTVGGIAILPLSGCVSDDCSTDAELTITVDDITVVDDGTCSRTITVTFLADDGCGNVSDPFVCNYNFLDNTGPVVNFNGIPDQGTYVVECDLPSTTWDPLIETADLTITDNCSDIDFAGITVELSQLYDGPCNNNVLTRWQQVWVISDVCGNETTYTLFTEIIDTTAPDFISVPNDLTLECDQHIPESEVEAFDSCSEVILDFVETRTDGNCPYNYTLTRTWTATDGCGNANTATQVITVEDTTPPEIIFTEGYLSDYSPGDEVFVECSEYGNISLLIANSVAARDNCSGQVPTTYTFEDLGNFDCAEFGYSGHLVSTWTATDECGNTSVATINWFLVDQSPPEFQGVPADICTDELPPVPNVQVVDDCEFAVLEFSQSEPIDCEGGQYIERTWTATDICGNTATAMQRITLSPGNGPMIGFDYPGLGDVMDGDMVRVPVDCGVSFEEVLVELEAAVSIENNCNASNTEIELELVGEGDCTVEGYLARYRLSVSATDVCGNTSTFGLLIDLVDETPPIVTSPEEITISCGSEVPTIKATDECGDVASITFVDSSPIEPSCASDPQVFERVWTVTDLCGNSTTFTQLISVIDNTGPVFVDVPADTCEDETIDGTVSAIDECTGDEVAVQFSEATSIEPGCGEVLTRIWTATDACGNTSTTTQQVFYADEIAPTISFAHPLLAHLESGDEFLISVGGNLGSPEDPFLFTADDVDVSDNCASNLLAEVAVSTSLSDDCAADGFLATYEYIWTASDPCGNTSVAKLTVYYIDKGSPDFFNVPAGIEVYCDNVPAPVAPIVSDDYDTEVEVTFDETQVTSSDGLLITRTWTAVDDCGNVGTASQKILVVDNTLSTEFVLNPEVVACNSDDNLLSVIASGGNPPYSYEWALSSPLEDGYITSDPTQSSILFTMGFITQTFTVMITDAEGCQLVQSYTVVCDFEDEEGLTGGSNSSSQLQVYPNPARDYFQLRAAELVEEAVTIRLYNLWGQEVLRTPVAYWPQDGWEVSTTGLPNGTYLLHLEREGKAPLMREIVVLD